MITHGVSHGVLHDLLHGGTCVRHGLIATSFVQRNVPCRISWVKAFRGAYHELSRGLAQPCVLCVLCMDTSHGDAWSVP